MESFKAFCQALQDKIQAAYTEGVSMEDAEKLAGEFLFAQMRVSDALKTADLDARMRKSGVKAVKATVYLDTVQSAEKKPTEAQLAAIVDTNALASAEQNAYDTAEVEKASLERYYDIFLNAHIFFRGVAKGRFE